MLSLLTLLAQIEPQNTATLTETLLKGIIGLALLLGVTYLIQHVVLGSRTRFPAPDDVAEPPPDAQDHEGVFFKVLGPGRGQRSPLPSSSVTVHYTGWTTDGKMFDSTATRGKPATLPLKNTITGWQLIVPQMVIGERRRLWIPPALAYGDSPPGSMPKGMLVFDIGLVAIDGATE